MKSKIFILLLFAFSFSSNAQKILVLTIFRPTNVKQFRYYVKNEITLKVKSGKKSYHGTIVFIGDSNLVIANRNKIDTILVKQIRMIILDRSNYLTRSFSKACLIAGIGVLSLDIFNNLTNNESQIIKPIIVKESLAFLAASAIFKLYAKRKHRIGKRKILKVIDLSPY